MNFIKESVLQDWFIRKASAIQIGDCIENISVLDKTIYSLREAGCKTQLTARIGLEYAREICSVLLEGKYLFQNRSIAPRNSNQMRPDLVLISSSGNYVLIELKTNLASERQAVQELLAYSTSIKLQQPYTNNFMYVVVAQEWTALLRHSVQALILDGKHVLPLRWLECGNGDFSLHILLDLFKFDIHLPYDPWYAMVPHTLAISEFRHGYDYGRNFPVFRCGRYFWLLGNMIVRECMALLQSGFVLSWSNIKNDVLTSSLTVVTVNQNWLYSEHRHGDPSEFLPNQQAPFGILIQSVATTAADEYVGKVSGAEDNVFAFSDHYSEVAEHFPSSSLSFNLIQKYRDRSAEHPIERLMKCRFEDGSIQNLEIFLKYLQSDWSYQNKIKFFMPFGELADFCGEGVGTPQVEELKSIFEGFRLYKQAR